MKSILIAVLIGLLLFGCMSLGLRMTTTTRRARMMLAMFFLCLPVLLAVHILSPADLGFLPPKLVAPVAWVDLGFCLFLYVAGFFGGLLQLYNLADRGFSLRILIDLLGVPGNAMTIDDVMVGYSEGRGIPWMYEKRIQDLERTGMTNLIGDQLALTTKGQRVATVFAHLQRFAQVEGASEAQ
jgi:hypothetical protein